MSRLTFGLFVLICCISACKNTQAPISTVLGEHEDLEFALMEIALQRLLGEGHFSSELERMRKTKDVYLHDVQVESYPWPFYYDPNELRIDSTALLKTPVLRGFTTHLISGQAYREEVPDETAWYLLESGNIDVSQDSATVVISVLCFLGKTKKPSICMSGGSIQYLFIRNEAAWVYDRVLRHLQV